MMQFYSYLTVYGLESTGGNQVKSGECPSSENIWDYGASDESNYLTDINFNPLYAQPAVGKHTLAS